MGFRKFLQRIKCSTNISDSILGSANIKRLISTGLGTQVIPLRAKQGGINVWSDLTESPPTCTADL
jgi:hypothetical protein